MILTSHYGYAITTFLYSFGYSPGQVVIEFLIKVSRIKILTNDITQVNKFSINTLVFYLILVR